MLTHRSRVALAVAALATVALLGGYVSLLVGALGVMTSAGAECGSEGEAPICSPNVQSIVFFLPLAGWVVAVALGAVGVARVARRDQGASWPLAIGVGVLVTTMAISIWIAERPVQP